MRELALHILDLVENSLRAQATTIVVTVAADTRVDRLRIAIEDNGPGLSVPANVALDPFYTTKSGKRTGLGLSLFQAAAEQAGGRMTLEKSALGGLSIVAEFGLAHVDRTPLGDLGESLAAIVLTNPAVDFRFCVSLNDEACEVRVVEVIADVGRDASPLKLARCVQESIRVALAKVQASTGVAL